MASDPDLKLLRLLLREQRLDVATLQTLRQVPNLDAVLAARGLLTPQEIASYRASLTPGASAGLGQIDDYRLTGRLGQGGMGAVYAAEHVSTGQRRAIKVATALQGAALTRFNREGHAQAQVDSHPNVLRVYGGGVSGNKHYLVMDLATGGDLQQKLERGPLDPSEAADVVAQLADGLAHVHAHQILHRDLKPANVLFDEAGVPLLVDFGLARLVDVETLTRTHALLGTPAYMAPEQVRGARDQVDVRTDTYALGAVLYECLTGRYMFESCGGLQVLVAVINARPIPPRSLRPEIPPWLEEVCLKALSKAPEDRFQSAAEFAAALRAGERQERPQRGRAALLVGLAALAIAAGVAWLARPNQEPTVDPVPQIAARVHEGLRAARPFRDDAAALQALRSELDALVDGEERAAAIDYDLLVWAGCVSLALEDTAQARTHARAARSLESRLTRRSEAFRPSPLSAALRASLDAQGDPQATVEALDAAVAEFERPELKAWCDAARLRLVEAQIKANDYKGARRELASVHDLAAAQPEQVEACVQHCRREIEISLRRIATLRPGQKNADQIEQDFHLVHLLDFLRALRPEGALADEQFEALLAFGTAPLRMVITVAPALADLRPADARVQRLVTQHWRVLDRRLRTDRVSLAKRYQRAAERAFELAKTREERGLAGNLLADLLRISDQHEACLRVCAELLETDLDASARAEVLSTRAELYLGLPDLTLATADIDASLALHDAPMAHARKAATLMRTRDKANYPEAQRHALLAVRGLDTTTASRASDVYYAYGRSVLIAWKVTVQLHAGFELALEALDDLLGKWSSAAYVGWLIRRAHYRLRVRPAQVDGAIADLTRALELLPLNAQLKDLVPQLTKALASVRDTKGRSHPLTWKLCQSVERRRKPRELLP